MNLLVDRLLSLSKPPSQDFSHSGRFDASTSSATASSTTAFYPQNSSVAELVEATIIRFSPQRTFRQAQRPQGTLSTTLVVELVETTISFSMLPSTSSGSVFEPAGGSVTEPVEATVIGLFPTAGVSTSSTTTGSTTAFYPQNSSVAEPVKATITGLFPQRAFRCFDKLSNHRLNDRKRQFAA